MSQNVTKRRGVGLRVGLLLAVGLAVVLLLGGCTPWPLPSPVSPISPVPTLTDFVLPMPMYPTPTPTPVVEISVPVIDDRPDEGVRFRATYRTVSYAQVDWSMTFYIPASTHFHRVDLVKEVREMGTGRVLLFSRIVTGILSKDYEPEPLQEVAASWEYNADILEHLNVTDAEEWVKPLLVCVREDGDTEPCLCRLVEGGPLEDCTELVGRCTGTLPYLEQDEGGFCFTNYLSSLVGLYEYWCPLVIFGVEKVGD